MMWSIDRGEGVGGRRGKIDLRRSIPRSRRG